MIDIIRQKSFFPLRNFEDVERLFEFNIDEANGEPNLALLSIVAGLIEHSLVTISDRDDFLANSRPVNDRRDRAQRTFGSNRLINSSSHHNHQNYNLSSTSTEHLQGSSTSSSKRTETTNIKSIQDAANSKLQSTNQTRRNIACKSTVDIHLRESNEAGYVVSCSGDSSDRSSICSTPEYTANDNLEIPEIEFEIVETLYKRFVDQVKGTTDFKNSDSLKTNLRIKEISDSVWKHLSNSYYKDKTHLQSIFSYLTTSKLDCFGLAFAVIAGCQILNLKNIHLALSEDHAWVMFDLPPDELKSTGKDKEISEYAANDLPIPTCVLHGTCEVTWHGKANSDKRGQSVTYKNCWLYTNGYAVKCDTRKCVAALVNSINPSINSNTDSEILALLQQRLLWLMFHKKNYFPMSLGNLGELEDLCPTPNAPMTPHELFNLGIEISRTEYNDSHVYPYTYLASFFFNHGRFKEALETWADSSAVMTKYNYSRDDEEIYKEFFEVANELIPSMLKVLTAGGLEPAKVSLKPFLQDPECLALILKFYDNICCWEEGSSTPVLHIGWAKNFVATVLKFNSLVRSKIKLLTEEEWTQSKASASECEVASSRADQCSSTASDQQLGRQESPPNCNDNNQSNGTSRRKNELTTKQEVHDINAEYTTNNYVELDHEDDGLESTSSTTISTANGGDSCGNRKSSSTSSRKRKRAQSFDHDNQPGLSPSEFQQQQSSINFNARGSNDPQQIRKIKHPDRRLEFDNENNVAVILRSRKIAGVRDLLQAERLNKTAIELQLTAQSQCAVRGRSNSSSAYSSDFISSALVSITGGSTTRSKRSHR